MPSHWLRGLAALSLLLAATSALAAPRLVREGEGRITGARDLAGDVGCATATSTGRVGDLTRERGRVAGFRFRDRRHGDSYINVDWDHIAKGGRNVSAYVEDTIKPGADLTLTILSCGAAGRIEMLEAIVRAATPAAPGPSAAATPAPAPAPAVEAAGAPASSGPPGTIAGTLLFPAGFMPHQTVCAEPVGGGAEICRNVRDGGRNRAYRLQVPPGRYHVYARLNRASDSPGLAGHKAYWAENVRCGLHVACKSFDKIAVDVAPGQTVGNIVPGDWYSTR